MIKFSIVIPTYNRADLLLRAVNSALQQDYDHFEVIVVDDASTDNTKEVILQITDPKLKYFQKDINAERAAARNTGSKIASGDYIYFLDSDDQLYHHHLSEAAKTILQTSNPEFLHPGYEFVSADHTLIFKRDNYRGDINKKIIKGNFIGSMFFLRKDIALSYPFNENRILSSGSEDYELVLRLAARFKINYHNTVTVTCFNHNGRSVLNVDKDLLTGRLHLLEKFIFQDTEFVKVYSKYQKQIFSDNRSYIALHLAMANHKRSAIIYLLKSLIYHPARALSTKRFYATIREILY